jgi:hypothetical protein
MYSVYARILSLTHTNLYYNVGMCGHRYNGHKQKTLKSGKIVFPCGTKNCGCPHFYYICAQGAWMLRCRCKHKHTDHDPKDRNHPCRKNNCSCAQFDSPWVCNCGCKWGDHTQKVVTRAVKTLEDMIQQANDLSGQTRADGLEV